MSSVFFIYQTNEDDQDPKALMNTFKDFSTRNTEKLQTLQHEVSRYEGLLEEMTRSKEEEEKKMASAGTVWQNAIMSVMRKQLQDLKASLRKKDSTLGIKVGGIQVEWAALGGEKDEWGRCVG